MGRTSEKLSVEVLLKAIKKKCKDCSPEKDSVKDCPIETCPLFKYRLLKYDKLSIQ